MAEILIPVGHDIGPGYDEPNSNPASYDVQFGDGTFELSSEEYAVWRAAHGILGQLSEDLQWTRAQTENLAGRSGVTDPAKTLDELFTTGLILRFDTTNEAAVNAFAGSHRTFAAARGLGNLPDNPEIFAIQAEEDRSVYVAPSTYFLWTFGHRSPNLWSACVALGQEAASREPSPLSVAEILDEFLNSAPRLLAGHCIYIDRSL